MHLYNGHFSQYNALIFRENIQCTYMLDIIMHL
nr:MAG TPA_asm: hypothetical protein [Caudoviricetes sp.]